MVAEDSLNIMVLVKHVHDENQLKVDRASGKVSFEGVPGKISDFDRNAVETALVLRGSLGGNVTTITLGTDEAVKALREVLAMGADRAVLIKERAFENFDVRAVAEIFSRALDKVGPFDLLLCAEGSVDAYTSLLAPALAEKLKVPLITYAESLQVKDGTIRAERALERRVEVVEAKLPAVVSVTGEINDPRIPTLLQIMGAMKKEVVSFTIQELGMDASLMSSKGYAILEYSGKSKERKRVVFEGTPAETAPKLIEALAKEGLVG